MIVNFGLSILSWKKSTIPTQSPESKRDNTIVKTRKPEIKTTQDGELKIHQKNLSALKKAFESFDFSDPVKVFERFSSNTNDRMNLYGLASFFCGHPAYKSENHYVRPEQLENTIKVILASLESSADTFLNFLRLFVAECLIISKYATQEEIDKLFFAALSKYKTTSAFEKLGVLQVFLGLLKSENTCFEHIDLIIEKICIETGDVYKDLTVYPNVCHSEVGVLLNIMNKFPEKENYIKKKCGFLLEVDCDSLKGLSGGI